MSGGDSGDEGKLYFAIEKQSLFPKMLNIHPLKIMKTLST